MTDLTPNIPEVVAEVSALFERYEQALIDKNVEVLDATFWNSPHTIRLANADFAAPVPGLNRRDEIGAMARAVSVFRENGLALRDAERQRSADRTRIEADK